MRSAIYFVTGPVQVRVEARHASAAEAILASLEQEAGAAGREPDEPQEEKVSANGHDAQGAGPDRLANMAVVWSVLWLGGLGSLLSLYLGLRALRQGAGASGFTKFKALFGVSAGFLGLAMWLYLWGLPLLAWAAS